MKTRNYLLPLLICCASLANAQLFSKRDIGIYQGFMSFHNPILNNKNNNNAQVSWVTEIDKHLYLTRFSSFVAGAGLGNYKNMDTRFLPFQSSNFFRMNAGLVFHLPQNYSPLNLSPKLLNPFFKAAYNFDFLEEQQTTEPSGRMSSSLRLGIGCIVKINHYIGISYEVSHNQRVAPDYRSFFQHTFGIVINLREPAKPF